MKYTVKEIKIVFLREIKAKKTLHICMPHNKYMMHVEARHGSYYQL